RDHHTPFLQPSAAAYWPGVIQVTMDQLPNEILLDIFDFHTRRIKDTFGVKEENINAWQTLIHVCRKWRNIVMSSSQRLNLRLLCTDTSPMREVLDIWPPFPIILWCSSELRYEDVDDDSLHATFEHPDRICEIGFFEVSSEDLDMLSFVMVVPFPELTNLEIRLNDNGHELCLSPPFL